MEDTTLQLKHNLSESPFVAWWDRNRFSINEACLATCSNVGRAATVRRLLSEAIDGLVSIDDRRLRGVIGYLVAESKDALEAIQQHREWAKARGGVR